MTATRGGKSTRPALAPVSELPRERSLNENHRADLAKSGLTDETCGLANLYTEHHHEAIAKLLGRRSWARLHGAALVFPFYLPGETEPHASRIKPTNPRFSPKPKRDGTLKKIKYDQAVEYGQLIYYPPRARARGAYTNAAEPLLWTEGEKKSLLLDQLGYACIGLTGVWNYGDVEHKRETGGERLDARIRDHVTIAGRHHVICYDADSRTNDDVMMAAGRLCGVLEAAGAASVKFVCPLSIEHKGIDDYFAAFGESVTRQLLASAEKIEPISPKDPLPKLVTVKPLRYAPIGGDLRLPAGYSIDGDGTLWKLGDEKHGDVRVSAPVLLIQRYLDDFYTGEGRVDVCFERDGSWVTTCVSRKAIIDARTMIAELGPFGAPVTSNNSSRIVDWLDVLARTNSGRIPRVACVSRAGWHEIDGHRVFVLDAPIVAEGVDAPQLELDARGDRKKLFGALRSNARDKSDAEQRRIENAHLEALRRAWRTDDVCAALIAGALATPLLEPLNAPNFAIHLPGDSSRGKTSMLKVAGSVFGNPQSEQWVANWNITPVAAELRASTLADLPQIYDEAGAADPETIQSLVYMLINGGGRARGQRDLQLRETPSWHTIVLSAGERGLVDETSATGAQIRVIQLPVSRFGDLGADGVDELRETCIAHAGVFGRLWIETLLTVEDWAPYRAAYAAHVRTLRASSTDALQARLASYFAVLCVAEDLASQVGLGEQGALTMRRLFASPSRREAVQPLAERARDLAHNWALAKPESFPEIRLQSSGAEDLDRQPRAHVLHGFRRGRELLFIPSEFRRWCEQERLSAREVLRSWIERGWLEQTKGRLDKSVRIGDRKVWLYVLGHAASPDDEGAFVDAAERLALQRAATALDGVEHDEALL